MIVLIGIVAVCLLCTDEALHYYVVVDSFQR